MSAKKVQAISPPSRLLTKGEAAHLLGVSPRTLDNSRYPSHSGSPLAEIPYVKLGVGPRASVRYEEQELARFIERHRIRRAG